jgi:formylglycine-generating enzyme required for sulfatase activity
MVYKGGCWYFGERFMRVADRHAISAQHRGNLIGFRMAYSTPSHFDRTS